jgi:cytochrome c oxidase subunit 2
LTFDSFLVGDADLEDGDLRQLAVDNYLVLPVNTSIRLITTSNDVIHNFAIPSLGLKIDSIPGRLNSVGVVINRESVFYGNCSELCGAYHAFMPTAIKAVSLGSYLSFINTLTAEL